MDWSSRMYLLLLAAVSAAVQGVGATPFAMLENMAGAAAEGAPWRYDSAQLATVPSANKVYGMQELVAEQGYALEEHFVTTEDGYILTVFRIPHPRHDLAPPRNEGRPVVLLQHALLDCSCSWVSNPANESLAYILSDAGFDVWLANSRGNTYSKNHTRLSTSSAEFWRFSFDEMALLDLPACIDYILDHTGAPTLQYVGHSQGATIGLAALSALPSLEERVSLAVLMAPAVFLQHVRGEAARNLALFKADELFLLAGAKEFLPSMLLLETLFGGLCAAEPGMCANVLSLLCGYNEANINTTRLPVYVSYTPAGTSVQNMAHWAQAIRSDQPRFLRYDYGTSCRTFTFQPRACNQEVYGQDAPPDYDLSEIRVPLALVTGGLDQLSDEEDIRLLASRLAKGVVVYQHSEPTYQHLDFTWAWNAAQLIYPPIVRKMTEVAGLDTAQE